MNIFLASTILFIIQNTYASLDPSLKWSIQEDLDALNISCPYGTCLEARISDTLSYNACQCGAICAQYGTCCIDSPYITITPSEFRPTCRQLDRGTSYYMVDRCPLDSPWKILCEEEWNGDDDVMKFVPVTSLFTLITYKNYFCFRCHEAGDDFRSWNVELGSDNELGKSIDENKPISVTYNRHYQTWVSPLGPGGSLVAVSLNIKVPLETNLLPETCNTELISRCSDAWSGEEARKKCEAYMGVMYIKRNDSFYTYRNVHCALCNFEDAGELSCQRPIYVSYGVKVPFSFTYLIDINRSDGDLVGKIQRCKSGHVWDPYAKKCRELMCALPGYVLRNRKCEAP